MDTIYTDNHALQAGLTIVDARDALSDGADDDSGRVWEYAYNGGMHYPAADVNLTTEYSVFSTDPGAVWQDRDAPDGLGWV